MVEVFLMSQSLSYPLRECTNEHKARTSGSPCNRPPRRSCSSDGRHRPAATFWLIEVVCQRTSCRTLTLRIVNAGSLPPFAATPSGADGADAFAVLQGLAFQRWPWVGSIQFMNLGNANTFIPENIHSAHLPSYEPLRYLSRLLRPIQKSVPEQKAVHTTDEVEVGHGEVFIERTCFDSTARNNSLHDEPKCITK